MKAITNRQCVVCGEGNVQLWTLDNLQKVSAMYLCWQHGKPLQELLEIAGDVPPDKHVPVPLRDEEHPVMDSGRHNNRMVPLLDWTPPEEAVTEEEVPEPGAAVG